jgi:hypothetical protein
MTGADSADRTLDELIPPPWSTARRVLVGLAVAVLLAAGGVLWWAGALAPNLVAQQDLGGSVEVGTWEDEGIADTSMTIHLTVANRGWVAATLEDWQPPDTEGVVWGATARPLPVTLDPGETVELELDAHITSCRDVDARGEDGVELVARGGLGFRSTTSVAVPARGALPSWPTHDGDGPITDRGQHDPSWLYHVFEWACDPSAVDLEERSAP